MFLLLFQLSKPKLSRKIVYGVKINLNKYWTKFGEIMNPRVNTRSSLLDRLTKERTRVATKRKDNDNVNKPEDNDEGTDKTSWITSPLRKRSRFQFLDSEGLTEIDENLVNEIREICSISANNKYSSCKCIELFWDWCVFSNLALWSISFNFSLLYQIVLFS